MSANSETPVPVLFNNIDVSDRVITITDGAFAFPAIMPIVPGHLLVCPRRIVDCWEKLGREEMESLFCLIADLKTALRRAFGATGFNTAWNEGEIAGQTVPHLHVHLVPRSAGDSGIVDYEPRKFLYRPGTRVASPSEELQDIAKTVRQHLPS